MACFVPANGETPANELDFECPINKKLPIQRTKNQGKRVKKSPRTAENRHVRILPFDVKLKANKLLRTDEQSFPFKQSVTSGNYDAALFPHSHFVDVPHINQQRTWDCGLYCVLMVLKTLGIKNCNIQELEKLCCTTSIWTVDLAYLLQKFAVSFSYFTVTLGANPDFSVEIYYKEQLPNDLDRVDTLFQKAMDAGINIEDNQAERKSINREAFALADKCRSISREQLSLLMLSGKYVAIVLVDQYILSRSWLEDVYVSSLYNGSMGYTGHYVVICGYDAAKDEFEIRDPASSRKHERITSRCLEKARKSFGTDEDLLLISLPKRKN